MFFNQHCIAASQDLEQLVSDRPQLLLIITKGDSIWNWLDEHFTKTNNLPVRWSSHTSVLAVRQLASHTYNSKGEATIMAADVDRNGNAIEGENLLSKIIYELINASHRDEFKALTAKVKNYEITKESYIRSMAEIEHHSVMELKQFYADYWIFYASKKHIKLNNNCWCLGASEDFDQWLWIHHRMEDGYPESIYGPMFDRLSHPE